MLACLFIGVGLANAQIEKVTGIVTSEEDGTPIIGAAVIVEDTNIRTVTDSKGNFVLKNLPANAKRLRISYIGMKTAALAIKPEMKIELQLSSETLEEVMVIAFGKAKKSAFTGSAATIKAEKITERQTSNVTNALSGQVAGVQITSANGAPGSEANIRIRGIGSISASNKPLFVVDGVPFDGGIETINPQDIASMTVLKDAASNALYGARGANGVILITTKRGSETGKPKVEVDAKWGTNRRAIGNYDVMKSPQQYYETFYQAVFNGMGRDPQKAAEAGAMTEKYLAYPIFNLNGAEALFTPDGKIDPRATVGNIYNGKYWLQPDNWGDDIFDNGNLRQEYNVRISGATARANYYMSAGYLDEKGIIPNSGLKRFTARANTEYQVNKRLRVGTNLSYSNTENRSPRDQEGSSSGNIFWVSNMMAPIYPMWVRDANKNIMIDDHGFQVPDFGAGEYPGLGRPFMGNSNPLSMVALDKQQYTYDVLGARAFAKLDIIEGLKFTANWGYDLDNTRYSNKYNAYYGQYAGETGGIIYVGSTRSYGLNQQYLLDYSNTFGKHSIDAMVGFESYKYKTQGISGSKEKLFNPNVDEIDNAINKPSVYSSTDTYMSQGILARAQYNYDSKYFGSISFRRDASSRFHPDNRWGNFWSIGGGWLIDKENFMDDIFWVNMLKLKMSYGVKGNDNIGGYYPYQDQYRVVNNNGSFAVSLVHKGNKDLTWETSHSFNTGFDFQLIDNRIGGSIEYFMRKTTDMLYNRPVASSMGYTTMPVNVGSMVNHGIELDMWAELIRMENISLGMNFNLTHFKNKIKKLAPELGGELIDGSRIFREGESMYQRYLRKYAGVNPENGNALYFKDVKDENGNVTGRETTEDWSKASRYASGDILPKVYGGLGFNFKAYGFDFAINMAYQLGGEVYDNTYASLMHGGTSVGDAGTNWHKDILKAWSPENKNSNIPKIQFGNKFAPNRASDRFMTSSDYLSINNITFGYTLPKQWLKDMASSVRIYFAADNVAVFAARKGLDPRQGYLGSSNDTYSPMRTISGGISLTF